VGRSCCRWAAYCRCQSTAPENAPNVVLILLDDVGFGATSTFGGPAQTPALENLAQHGLRYNRFHVTALCSPTRAALLSGRNDHNASFGTITDSTTDDNIDMTIQSCQYQRWQFLP